MTRIKIRAAEKYLPGAAVYSDTLARQLQLPPGWIEKNSGVVTRHWAGKQESVASMGAEALRRALARADLALSDLDLLIAAGASYDHPIPFNAALIKKQLDAELAETPCFDVDSTCLSFLHALDIAHLYLMHRGMKRIAIVNSELASRSLDPGDPKTYSLFGDGAVAVILEATREEGYVSIGSSFRNYTQGAELAKITAGGVVEPGKNTDPASFYFRMQGKQMIRLTLEKLEGFMEDFARQTNVALGAYDFLLPHQTSRIGNELFVRKYNLQPERMILTLSKYGNCISASIPLGLEELHKSNRLTKGTKVLLAGSAAGLSLGAVALQF
jgi:3-oxoacyl-[acyl-carrier-protein] synthase III